MGLINTTRWNGNFNFVVEKHLYLVDTFIFIFLYDVTILNTDSRATLGLILNTLI